MKSKLKTLILLVLCFGANASLAETSHSLGPAAQVVHDYAVRDLLGAGLSSTTWKYLQELTTWEDGPGFDSFTVISDFKIESEVITKDHAQVKVQYQILGQCEANRFVSRPGVQEVTFELVHRQNQWKIETPQLAPFAEKKNC